MFIHITAFSVMHGKANVAIQRGESFSNMQVRRYKVTEASFQRLINYLLKNHIAVQPSTTGWYVLFERG